MDGSPRVLGSSKVRVFIDGKPSDIYASSLAEALQQIPAETISKIEVVTQPSARYDAEGTDAVINIITKRSRYDGTTGQVNGVLGNRTQQAGVSVKKRKGKIISSWEGNWYKYRNPYGGSLERSNLQQRSEGLGTMNTHVFGTMLTWMIDTLNTFSAGYRYRNMVNKSNSRQDTWYDSLDYSRHIASEYGNNVHTVNAGYTNTSKNKKRELNLLSTMFFHKGYDFYNLYQVDDELINHKETNDNKTTNRELAIQADVMQMISTSSKLEAGFKLSKRKSISHNETGVFNFSLNDYERDDIRSNHFQYNRSVYAGYLSYLLSLRNWSIRTGIRYEQTQLNARFKEVALRIPGFQNWLPNILVSKVFNNKHTVKMNYSQKIVRPYTFYLNPNIIYIDSLNIQYGNPHLEPECTHSFQLAYTFNKGKWLTGATLLYDYRTRTIQPVRLIKAGISEQTYRNMDANPAYGASATISVQTNSGFSGSAAVTAQYVTVKNSDLHITNSGWTINGNSRFAYAFKKGWQCEMGVHVEPRAIYLQGIYDGWFFYNFIVNKKWWNDKLQTSFAMENFFSKYQYRNEVIQTETFTQINRNRYPVGFFKLSVSYRFGKKEIREPPRKQIEGE